MRLRYGLILFALFCCCPTAAAARELDPAFDWGAIFPFIELPEDVVAGRTVAAPEPGPPPVALEGRGVVYRTAYLDAHRILSAAGACSEFFGGALAVEAFNDLAVQLETKPVGERNVGMIMTGQTTIIVKNTTGRSYRLFERATLNSNGPFYGTGSAFPHTLVPRIGSFQANTRGARVLILLHELGHLLRQPDGRWLLPNDGGDRTQSERNTALGEQACGREIRALGND